MEGLQHESIRFGKVRSAIKLTQKPFINTGHPFRATYYSPNLNGSSTPRTSNVFSNSGLRLGEGNSAAHSAMPLFGR